MAKDEETRKELVELESTEGLDASGDVKDPVEKPVYEDDNVEEVQEPARKRSPKRKSSKVTIYKARGPRIMNEHGDFKNGNTYEVTKEAADYLTGIRGQHGEQFFERVG